MQFPLDLRFKVLSIASRITVRDARGSVVAAVKQKAFKLKEQVIVYGDENETQPLFHIDADRIIDFSAQYRITRVDGTPLGVVRRRGMRSLWRAQYEVARDNEPLFVIRESNPWSKVADGLLTEIPVVGLLAGYVFHPRYEVTRVDQGAVVMAAQKQPAFLETRFEINTLVRQPDDDERLAVMSLMMMLLLERRRG